MTRKYNDLQMLKQLVNAKCTEDEAETPSWDVVGRLIDLLYVSAATVQSDDIYDAIVGAFSFDAVFEIGGEQQ